MASAASTSVSDDLTARAALTQLMASHLLCAVGFSAFALLPKYLMTERGLSQAETGPGVMGLPLGALLFSLPVAAAMGRFSKTSILRACAFAFAGLTWVFVAEPSVGLVPVLTALLGGAAMGVFNAGAGLVSEAAAERGLARAIGLHGAAGMLGYAVGPLAIEALANHYGFRVAFGFAAVVGALGGLTKLPAGPPRATPLAAFDTLAPLRALLLVSLLAGVMHNALWMSHQPLVLARGGTDVRAYFVGMSLGALGMRVVFGGLPDRFGAGRSALSALGLYVLATLGMTWMQPSTLAWFGVAHGIAHGVFYPSIAALVTSRVDVALRGQALTALYAGFNVGATLASVGFARLGEALGPAAVFPWAAAIGSVGFVWLGLSESRRRSELLRTQ